MKTNKLLFIAVVTLTTVLHSFADETPDSLCTAFEIYVTKDRISYDFQVDYSTINLDTVELKEAPCLTSNQIESYDTVNHIINLKIPVDSLEFPQTPVYGQMFVVLANKEPVYCGFFWSAISSVPCHWIFMEDPNGPIGLDDFQIRISAGYPDHSFFIGGDPRNTAKIFDALQLCNVGLTGPGYVPFPTENAYWNVYYVGTCEERPPDTTLLRYTIRGDTTINDIHYHKLCMATGDKFQPKTHGIGGIREADKKIYYAGRTILSETYNEYLLYDFTKKIGDTIFHNSKGSFYSVVLDIDSILIAGNYRKRYKIESHSFGQSPDYIIEGIGSVLNGLLGNISDVTTCGTHYWEHVCFSENDVVKYLNPEFDDCFPVNYNSRKYYPLVKKTNNWSVLAAGICGCWEICCVSTNHYKFDGDTTIQSNHYKKMLSSTDSLKQNWELVGFIREDTIQKKVWARNLRNEEGLIYDFNISLGSEITLNNPFYWETNTYQVIKVDSILLQTGYRKVYTLCVDDVWEEQWIEGIGSKFGIINSDFYPVQGGFRRLLCFSDSNIEYLNPEFNTCYKTSFTPLITNQQIDTAVVNQEYHYQLTTTEIFEYDSISFLRNGGLLPNGLNLNKSTGLISGIPTETGTYHLVLCVNNNGYISDCFEADLVITIGTGKNSINRNNQITIHPNPVTHELQIENHTGKKLSLKIIDITGRTIVEQPLNDVKSAIKLNASPGIYAVLFRDERGLSIVEKKIVKQ